MQARALSVHSGVSPQPSRPAAPDEPPMLPPVPNAPPVADRPPVRSWPRPDSPPRTVDPAAPAFAAPPAEPAPAPSPPLPDHPPVALAPAAPELPDPPPVAILFAAPPPIPDIGRLLLPQSADGSAMIPSHAPVKSVASRVRRISPLPERSTTVARPMRVPSPGHCVPNASTVTLAFSSSGSAPPDMACASAGPTTRSAIANRDGGAAVVRWRRHWGRGTRSTWRRTARYTCVALTAMAQGPLIFWTYGVCVIPSPDDR